MNAAEGLERALRLAGRMMGLSETDVAKIKFHPHVDFGEPTLPAEEVIKLTAAYNLRAGLSRKSLHENWRRGRLTDMTYEEELKQIEKEENSTLGGPPAPAPPRVDNRVGSQPGAK